jgi:chaperonin GroEL (HSP60 family)
VQFIAEEIEGEALATLVVNKLRGTLHICVEDTTSDYDHGYLGKAYWRVAGAAIAVTRPRSAEPRPPCHHMRSRMP